VRPQEGTVICFLFPNCIEEMCINGELSQKHIASGTATRDKTGVEEGKPSMHDLFV